MDIASLDTTMAVRTDTVMCNFDFNNTVSTGRGKIAGVDGNKFFVAGYSLLIPRAGFEKSNLLTTLTGGNVADGYLGLADADAMLDLRQFV